jgi:uncharacterized protein (DUF1800 family)
VRLKELRGRLGVIRAKGVHAMLRTRVTSDTPFVERLVAFWSNHLCVSVASKRRVAALAHDYECSVVRRHVLGRYEHMVLASARHPAMLLYLDNVASIGPESIVGERLRETGHPRGLNENYARELLELHTLGVDGGYDQRDIVELARVLTGWTCSGAGLDAEPGEPRGFVFRGGTHDPGPKTVLGHEYAEDGEREGERAVHDLCAHPSTARNLAVKLARHFVADDPPPSAIDAVEKAYRESDGDLRVVTETLIDLDEAWQPENRKLRMPVDWIVASLRAVHSGGVPAQAPRFLTELRQTAWAPLAPKGYDDREELWSDSAALLHRGELARLLADVILSGSPAEWGGASPRDFEPSDLLSVVDVPPDDPLADMLVDPSISAAERLALAFAGPAFQWR